jgi:hypothetical protein
VAGQRLTWWPWYVPRRSPLCEYHAQTTWSLDTLKMMSPSPLYLTLTCIISPYPLPVFACGSYVLGEGALVAGEEDRTHFCCVRGGFCWSGDGRKIVECRWFEARFRDAREVMVDGSKGVAAIARISLTLGGVCRSGMRRQKSALSGGVPPYCRRHHLSHRLDSHTEPRTPTLGYSPRPSVAS